MRLLRKIWNTFTAKPEVWFFYAFLATFSLSIRKVIFFYPILGQFNEYSGIYLYLSDIFLILVLLSWIISILYNNNYILSIIRGLNVPRGTILLPTLLVFWSFISIFWSLNPVVAFFKSLKLLEFYLLYLLMIIKIVPRETILKNSFKIIIATGTIQAIIGIWQFLIQSSIGFFWLKESLISSEIPGVAKLIIDNERIIRAYGLFPHPNILGGFLLLSIIITLTYEKMFHVEQSAPESSLKCSTWNNSQCESYTIAKNVPRETFRLYWQSIANSEYLFKALLIIQIIALLLTFSKSAIIGLILAIAYPNLKILASDLSKKLFHVEHLATPGSIKCSTWNNSQCESYTIAKNVPRGTFNPKKWFLMICVIIASAYLINPDFNSLLFKSLDERALYLDVSRGTILDNPLIGLGAGQFVINMQNYTNQTLFEWQFQPVHNVFLLIWSELGLIGLLLFILFIRKLFHVEQSRRKETVECSTWNNSQCASYKIATNVPRGTFPDQKESKIAIQGVLIGFMFIMFFDHYPWDIQQGQIIFWLILGLSVSLSSENIDK
ncbi:MAG: O-antigen ligase family protein [Parcubacteria group bacterium]